MRPESIQAMAKAAMRVPLMKSAAQPSRLATSANAISVGSPTEISQGTVCAVAEPVMRSTPSDQTTISLVSFAARWRATDGEVLRSRPIQLGPSTLRAITMPFSLTMRTTLPAGRPCTLSAS